MRKRGYMVEVPDTLNLQWGVDVLTIIVAVDEEERTGTGHRTLSKRENL